MAICQRRRASLDLLKHQLDNIDDALWKGTHSGHFFPYCSIMGEKPFLKLGMKKNLMQ